MICIYVALQIGATHTINKPQTDNLAAAFVTLDKAIEQAGGEALDVLPDEVAKLRKVIRSPKAAQKVTDTQTASEPEETATQEVTATQTALD